MFESLKTLARKWRASRNASHQLDALLAVADANASYAERSEWLIELAHWLHRNGHLDAAAQTDDAAAPRSQPEHVRMRYLLRVLERNPAWKASVAGILRRLLRESDTLSLLCDAGMPAQPGLLGALVERAQSQLISPAPNRRDLASLVTLMFPSAHDPEWIATLPADLLKRLRALFDAPANLGAREAGEGHEASRAGNPADIDGNARHAGHAADGNGNASHAGSTSDANDNPSHIGNAANTNARGNTSHADDDTRHADAASDAAHAAGARRRKAPATGGPSTAVASNQDGISLGLLAALHNLTCQISSTGLSPAVRSRLGPDDDAHIVVERLPFFRLTRAMLAVEEAREAHEVHEAHEARSAHAIHGANAHGERSASAHPGARPGTADTGAPGNVGKPNAPSPAERLRQEVRWLRLLLDECLAATDDVFSHLYRNGVKLDTVFQVERMRMRIVRAELLLDAWLASADAATQARLAATLVRANQQSQSVVHLWRNNMALLSRKVVELSADTGEHYIARDRADYLKMMRMAAGGGLVTVVTVYVKFGVLGAHLPQMLEGLLAGVNYAASFLLMHFLHFTLATKQPAMTAPTLARELDGAQRAEGRARFVSSVVALVRTQAAAVLGNVLLVFPFCLAVQLLCHALFHVDLISAEKAHATLHSFSLAGPTPFYAVLTGVLLWLSSVFAGWADNWFALYRVSDALAYNRRLRITLGAAGAARLARFCRSNVAGVAGNLTLGLMLGLVPAIVSAFAFPFEVRHVTLSAGSIGAAVGVLGHGALRLPEFWWALAGTLSMAVLNVAVSFALAFHMAIRSRDLHRKDVAPLARAFWRHVARHPLDLVWPLSARREAADAGRNRPH